MPLIDSRKIICSFFESKAQTELPKQLSLWQILTGIKKGTWKDITKKGLELYISNKKEYKDWKKETPIPAFTLSVQCNHRKDESRCTEEEIKKKIISYTNLMQIDIDHVDVTEIDNIKRAMNDDPYIYTAFKSISGHGIKAIIAIEEDKRHQYFESAKKYFKDKYNSDIDSVRDLFRLCFISYDKDLELPMASKQVELLPLNLSFNSKVAIDIKEPKNTSEYVDDIPRIHNNINMVDKIKAQCYTTLRNILLSAKHTDEKHNARRTAGNLAGGWVAGGIFTENDIYDYLLELSDEIAHNGKTNKGEIKTLQDAINKGKSQPITLEQEIDNRRNFAKTHYPNQTKNLSQVVEDLNTTPTIDVVDTSTGEVIAELPFCFWYEKTDKKQTTVAISHEKLLNFIIDLGFCNVKDEYCDNSIIYNLVYICQGIAEYSSLSHVRNLVRENLNSLPYKISENCTKEQLLEIFTRGIDGYINKSKLDLLPIKSLTFLQDTEYSTHIFYSDYVVTVKKAKNYDDAFTYRDYKHKDFEGLIFWKSSILNRKAPNYDDLLNNFEYKNTAFAKFVNNLAIDPNNNYDYDPKRHRAIKLNLLGFPLHRWKNSDSNRLTIISEANNPNDIQSANGGAGKSLLTAQTYKHFRKICIIDGKNLKQATQFQFQSVNDNDEIIVINDVVQSFSITHLFPSITEAIEIEKKFGNKKTIPIERGPKIVVSTNYAIQGSDDSALRRINEIEIFRFYNKEWTPRKDFNESFFDWDEKAWSLFDIYILKDCVYPYLANGGLYEYESDNLNERKLNFEISPELCQYLDDNIRDTNVRLLKKKEFYEQYLEKEMIDKKYLSAQKFKKFVFRWASVRNINISVATVKEEGSSIEYYKINKSANI